MVATQQAQKKEAKERRADAKKRKVVEEPGEQRKSSRERKEVNYAEESFFPKGVRAERQLVVPDALKLDLATAEELRAKASGMAANRAKRCVVDRKPSMAIGPPRSPSAGLGNEFVMLTELQSEDRSRCR